MCFRRPNSVGSSSQVDATRKLIDHELIGRRRLLLHHWLHCIMSLTTDEYMCVEAEDYLGPSPLPERAETGENKTSEDKATNQKRQRIVSLKSESDVCDWLFCLPMNKRNCSVVIAFVVILSSSYSLYPSPSTRQAPNSSSTSHSSYHH